MSVFFRVIFNQDTLKIDYSSQLKYKPFVVFVNYKGIEFH